MNARTRRSIIAELHDLESATSDLADRLDDLCPTPSLRADGTLIPAAYRVLLAHEAMRTADAHLALARSYLTPRTRKAPR